MKKTILALAVCVMVVIGFSIAQGGGGDDQSREDSTEDFSNMTYEERMAKLAELEAQYRSEGKTGAADFIANQMQLITN